MRVLYYNIVIMIILLFLGNNKLFSQYLDTPLNPAKDKVQGWNGFIFGLGQNFQSGEYYVDCEDCIFDGGVNTGFTLGYSYDRRPIEWLKYGIAIYYDNSGIKNTFSETELVNFQLENSDIKEKVPVKFKHNSDVDLHLLTAMPYLKFEPFNWYFFRLGLGVSYILSSKINHTKELLQNTATLSNGSVVTIKISDSDENKVTIQDSPIRELNSIQWNLIPATGFKFNFSETTYLLTYIQYNIPFTNISEQGKDYKINEWRLFLELGFKIH